MSDLKKVDLLVRRYDYYCPNCGAGDNIFTPKNRESIVHCSQLDCGYKFIVAKTHKPDPKLAEIASELSVLDTWLSIGDLDTKPTFMIKRELAKIKHIVEREE